MKRVDLSKWENIEDCAGLLFFAQSLVELLFDHSLDSFKSPALNLHSSALEVNHFLSKLVNSEVPEKSISFALQELIDKVKSDIVLDSHSRKRCLGIVEKIDKLLKNPREALVASEALLSEVRVKYWPSMIKQIETCVKSASRKADIRSLAVAFTSELDQLSISKSYAYHKTLKFFFSPNVEPRKIMSSEVVSDFLKLFTLHKRSWTVIMKGSDGFIEISEKCEMLGLGVVKEELKFPYDKKRWARFVKKANGYNIALVLNEVSAKDVHMARLYAQEYIESIVEILMFHNHSLQLDISAPALVVGEDDRCFVIDDVPNPMLKGVLVRNAESEGYTQTSIMILAGLRFERSSMTAFRKAFDFHRAALNAATAENQLIDLWAALEGLLPQPVYGEKRIEKFIAYVVPTLTLSYPAKLFISTSESLRCSSPEGYSVLDSITSGQEAWEKLAVLLASESLIDKRAEMYSCVSNNPLLVYRMNWLHDNFCTSKAMHKFIKSHEDRVDRHLRRIYATRNHVVHNAQSLPYITTLIENLHSYLDTVLLSLGAVAMNRNDKISIAIAFEILSSYYTSYVSGIKGATIPFDVDNVLDYIDGGCNPLIWHSRRSA